MQLHADHSLFFEDRESTGAVALSAALTLSVLFVNAAADSVFVSLLGSGLGAVLLGISWVGGQHRFKPALTWTISLVALAIVAGIALDSNMDVVAKTGVRILCGVVWVLWLGTRVDWAALRQLLLRLRVPEDIVFALDHAIMHGILTRREWEHRRDAAQLRLGTHRLPLSVWGPLLGEGALEAFARLELTEEHARLRRATPQDGNHDEGEAVRLDCIDIKRGDELVLEQFELLLGRSEQLLVCGPSGAGKSSLLRLIAGLDGPAEGTMTRFGKRVSPESPLRERLDGRVALLSQNPQHHFIASTVAEDIAWGLLRRGIGTAEAERRAREVASALGIDHLLERPCHQLSFGEQRRAALAGLLVLEPSLLLLDEPTAGLDPVASHELRMLVETTLRQTGAACIWATHDLHSLPARSKRVVLIRDRQLIFDGPTREGLSTPKLVRAGLAVGDRDDPMFCPEDPLNFCSGEPHDKR